MPMNTQLRDIRLIIRERTAELQDYKNDQLRNQLIVDKYNRQDLERRERGGNFVSSEMGGSVFEFGLSKKALIEQAKETVERDQQMIEALEKNIALATAEAERIPPHFLEKEILRMANIPANQRLPLELRPISTVSTHYIELYNGENVEADAAGLSKRDWRPIQYSPAE